MSAALLAAVNFYVMADDNLTYLLFCGSAQSGQLW
jgi:hypothetical protein